MSDAEVILRKLLNKTLDDLEYKPRDVAIEANTSGGANYTSALFTIDVTSPHKEDLHLFAKVAIIGEKLREQMLADALFETEDVVYSKLVSYYDHIQDKYDLQGDHRFLFPKLYASNCAHGEETLIFENLYKKGFDMFSRFESVDWAHAEVAVSNLAKFHALSFAFEREYPQQFAEIAVKRGFPQSNKNEFEKSFADYVQKTIGLIEDEKLQMKVGQFLQREFNPEGQESRRDMSWYYQSRGTTVISHGDYRVSNVMYKEQNGKVSSIALDYQMVHGGCPATDLLYFVTLGSDEEFRRKHFQDLVEHYYDQLTLALKRLHLDVTEVYPREQFDKEFKQSLPFSLLLSLFVLPVVVVTPGSGPQVSGQDAELSQFIISPNQLYAERLNGIVRDCAKWGVI